MPIPALPPQQVRNPAAPQNRKGRRARSWWRPVGLAAGWAGLLAGSAVHSANGWLGGHVLLWHTLVGAWIVATGFYLRGREHGRDHEIFHLGMVAGIRLRNHGLTEDDVVIDLPDRRTG